MKPFIILCILCLLGTTGYAQPVQRQDNLTLKWITIATLLVGGSALVKDGNQDELVQDSGTHPIFGEVVHHKQYWHWVRYVGPGGFDTGWVLEAVDYDVIDTEVVGYAANSHLVKKSEPEMYVGGLMILGGIFCLCNLNFIRVDSHGIWFDTKY